MLIFSETSKIFIERVREEIRALFFLEIEKVFPVKFNRSRILYKNFQYPLNIVVFEDQNRLGYFDHRYYEVGISKKLMFTAFDNVIRNVIRHEIAHYLCFLFYGPGVHHDEKFRDLCKKLNWNEDVYHAYANLEKANIEISSKSEKNIELLNKVKKLMALASSDNAHESELATIKANKLLLDYNLTLTNQTIESEIYVSRVLTSKKKNAKHIAIYEILKTFYVSPVFNHGKSQFYLEIVGNYSNVEIADYVASFLDSELDRLWNEIKKNNSNLKGAVAKNSFFRGLAHGYVSKIKTIQSESASPGDLIKIEHQKNEHLKMVYSRLGSSSSKGIKNNSEASSLGKSAGMNLSIKPGLKSNSKTLLLS